jgi:hypothetical protein
MFILCLAADLTRRWGEYTLQVPEKQRPTKQSRLIEEKWEVGVSNLRMYTMADFGF